MRKNTFVKVLGCFLFSFFMSLFCSNIKINGATYDYLKGRVVESYKKVDVISFNYDYITIFDEEKIYDNDFSLSGEKFYSGKSITLEVDEYSSWSPFAKESDRTNIYKYDSQTKDFDSRIHCFDNDNGTYNFTVEGIYKVEYVFEGEVIYVKYICINKSINYVSVVGDSRYENTSAYSEFSFKLVLKDAYNLKNNKYYYAFGLGSGGLKFREFSVFSEDELKASKSVNEVARDLLVDIKDSDVTIGNSRKYFYVKVVNEAGGETIIGTSESFLLASKIQANVYLLDDNGAFINDHVFYKAGDKINFKVIFNTNVTFENMQFTINGYKFIDVKDVTSSSDEVKFEYLVESVENFVGNFNLKSKYSSNAIVRSNGINAVLEVIPNVDFEVDVTKPGISFFENGGLAKKEYQVPISVDEFNIESFSYYVSKCVIAQGNKCLDSFDDRNKGIINLGSVTNYTVKIDEGLGVFNSDNLALFVKVVDKAGNVSTFVKMGYIVDNVIVPKGEENYLFDFVDIYQGETIVGRKLQVLLDSDYMASSVSYEFENGDKESCYYQGSNLGNEIYDCLSIEDYDFNSKIKVTILDEYGNVESYLTNFKFSTVNEGSFVVDDKVFNSYRDEEYDLEYNMYNYMKNDDQGIVFNSDVLDAIYRQLNFNKIPNLRNLNINLIYVDDENLIVLEDNIDSVLVLPTAKKLVELLKGVEKIKYCSIEKCDMNIYLRYEYEISGISQSRLVKVNYIDSTNKYIVDNFNVNNKLNVGEKFNDFNYKYISNLNVEINENDIEIFKEILFEDKNGNVSVVEYIDTSVLGKYTVTESFVYGSTGSFPLSYVVEVVDSVAPLIRLKGKDRIVVRIGEKFIDPFVSVSDNYDTNLTVQTKVDPVLDVNVEGVYLISYWCEDSNGNVSDVVTRTVVVLERNTTKTYIICGGIIFATILIVVISVIIEVKRQRKIRK